EGQMVGLLRITRRLREGGCEAIVVERALARPSLGIHHEELRAALHLVAVPEAVALAEPVRRHARLRDQLQEIARKEALRSLVGLTQVLAHRRRGEGEDQQQAPGGDRRREWHGLATCDRGRQAMAGTNRTARFARPGMEWCATESGSEPARHSFDATRG